MISNNQAIYSGQARQARPCSAHARLFLEGLRPEPAQARLLKARARLESRFLGSTHHYLQLTGWYFGHFIKNPRRNWPPTLAFSMKNLHKIFLALLPPTTLPKMGLMNRSFIMIYHGMIMWDCLLSFGLPILWMFAYLHFLCHIFSILPLEAICM